MRRRASEGLRILVFPLEFADCVCFDPLTSWLQDGFRNINDSMIMGSRSNGFHAEKGRINTDHSSQTSFLAAIACLPVLLIQLS